MNWSNYSNDTTEGGKWPKVHCGAKETSTMTWFFKSMVLFCADWSYWARNIFCLQALKWFVACLKVQFQVLHFLMQPFKNIISKSAHFLLLCLSFCVLRLLPADPVPTLSALLPGLHASHLGGWPTSWFACGGERHHGGFRECQPRHVCNYRQVRVINPGMRALKRNYSWMKMHIELFAKHQTMLLS